MNRQATLREKNGGPRWAILAACCYGMMTVSFVNADLDAWRWEMARRTEELLR